MRSTTDKSRSDNTRQTDLSDPFATTLAILLFCDALVVAAVLAALFPADAWGHAIAAGTFAILLHPRIRRSRSTVVAVTFVLMTHHVVAYANASGEALPGADADALGFHRKAALLAQGVSLPPEEGPHFVYIQCLTTLYRVTGPSLLAGAETSVLAFALAALLFFALCDSLNCARFSNAMFLLFGLLPALLIFTSVTLRESWQVLFTLFAAHSAIRLKEQVTLPRACVFLIATTLLGSLHYALTLYALGFGLATVLWAVWRRMTAGAVAIALFTGAGLVIAWTVTKSALPVRIASGRPLEIAQAVDGLRTRAQGTRATYGGALDTTTVGSAMRSTAKIVLLYWFAPLPHQVKTARDLYAAVEGLLRAVLLLAGLGVTARRARTDAIRRARFLFCAAVALEIMWALGTVNWGTAVRHHLLAYPLLVIVGGSALPRLVRRPDSEEAQAHPGGSVSSRSCTSPRGD